MGVFVRGMEMPTCCVDCDLHNPFSETPYCRRLLQVIPLEGRMENCPLVEVPTPHGRLIDADKLHDEMYHRAFETDGDTMWQSGCWVRYRAVQQVQDNAQTVIEAEE